MLTKNQILYRRYADRIRKCARKTRRKARINIINILGGKCIRCGYSDYRALQIDHVNGDGSSERKLVTSRGWYSIVEKSFLAGENRYQLLCANCNWIKKYENDENSNLKNKC